jgi:hypothetical protein
MQAHVVPSSEAPGDPPRARAPWVAVASTLLAVLAPKCPLCLAAYLSIFGVTVGAASVVLQVLRPLALVVSGLAIGFVFWRRRRPTAPLPCCRPRSG